MKSLKTLIKLNKQKLDQLRRQMGSLENRKAQLIDLSERLKAELAREIELAQQSQEMSAFFGDFAKRIRDRQDGIKREVAELEVKMEVLRELIRDAFAEVKKYEIALENRQKQQAKKRDKLETEQLDEIAGQRHARTRELEE